MDKQVYTWETYQREFAQDAKYRCVQLITSLQAVQKQNLVLRGEGLERKVRGLGRPLIEYLLKARVADRRFRHAIRFAVYRVVRRKRGWVPCRFPTLMDGTELRPTKGPVYDTEDEAWAFCELWFQDDKHNESLAKAGVIVSPPIDCTQITEDDFMQQELVRVNVERFRQPNLYKLCVELGLETAVKSNDIRLGLARLKDRILNSGRWPDYLPRKYHPFLRELWHAHEKSKTHSSRENRARNKVRVYIAKYGFFGGLNFDSKADLTAHINRKFGTKYKVATLARDCKRLGMPTKRRNKPEHHRPPCETIDEDLKRLALSRSSSGTFMTTENSWF